MTNGLAHDDDDDNNNNNNNIVFDEDDIIESMILDGEDDHYRNSGCEADVDDDDETDEEDEDTVSEQFVVALEETAVMTFDPGTVPSPPLSSITFSAMEEAQPQPQHDDDGAGAAVAAVAAGDELRLRVVAGLSSPKNAFEELDAGILQTATATATATTTTTTTTTTNNSSLLLPNTIPCFPPLTPAFFASQLRAMSVHATLLTQRQSSCIHTDEIQRGSLSSSSSFSSSSSSLLSSSGSSPLPEAYPPHSHYPPTKEERTPTPTPEREQIAWYESHLLSLADQLHRTTTTTASSSSAETTPTMRVSRQPFTTTTTTPTTSRRPLDEMLSSPEEGLTTWPKPKHCHSLTAGIDDDDDEPTKRLRRSTP